MYVPEKDALTFSTSRRYRLQKLCSDLCWWLSQGTAVYVPEKEALVWKIKSFPGGREFLLRAKFSLPSVAAEEEPHGRLPPMRVNFEIPYFTVSGIQVSSRT